MEDCSSERFEIDLVCTYRLRLTLNCRVPFFQLNDLSYRFGVASVYFKQNKTFTVQFIKTVPAKQHLCNTETHFCLKQQTQLQLSTCKTSILCWFFLTLVYTSIQTVLLQTSWSSVMSSSVHTSLDRPSNILFSCA